MTKAKTAKTTKAAKVDAPKTETKVSAVTRLKELLCDKPTLSSADLTQALTSEGYVLTPSSVSTVRIDFLRAIKVLQDAGLLKRKMI